MSTSGTYEFGSTTNEKIIREAYERVGVVGNLIVGQKVESALMSLNFICVSWINKRLNLFTIKQGMLGLVPGQGTYIMPGYVVDILKCSLRNSTRNLGGTAVASEGAAINAFDGNPDTACTQTTPNGNISYSWGGGLRAISMIGVMSFVDRNYTLKAQYSYDGATWVDALVTEQTSYRKNIIEWFTIPTPISAGYFRILETGGSVLNISELYFNNNTIDSPLSKSSWSDYNVYANKDQIGTPCSFWFDRQITPVLNIYQVPGNIYNNIFYTFKRQIQDIGDMVDTAEIPTRFFDALTSELAYRLCIKEKKLELLDALKQEAYEAFKYVAFEDEESVPVKITPKAATRWSAR